MKVAGLHLSNEMLFIHNKPHVKPPHWAGCCGSGWCELCLQRRCLGSACPRGARAGPRLLRHQRRFRWISSLPPSVCCTLLQPAWSAALTALSVTRVLFLLPLPARGLVVPLPTDGFVAGALCSSRPWVPCGQGQQREHGPISGAGRCPEVSAAARRCTWGEGLKVRSRAESEMSY